MENLQNYTNAQMTTLMSKLNNKVNTYPEPLKELLLYSTVEEWDEILNGILDNFISTMAEQSNVQDLMYNIRLLQQFFKRL